MINAYMNETNYTQLIYIINFGKHVHASSYSFAFQKKKSSYSLIFMNLAPKSEKTCIFSCLAHDQEERERRDHYLKKESHAYA